MCGIFGFICNNHSKKTGIDLLKKMSLALTHRGPDNSGLWADSDMGLFLGHTRLSIIDTSIQGSQPMLSTSNRYVIIFNGEIYNHRELKNKLAGKSISWKGHSDTEVLLNFIEIYGLEKTLNDIVGMFAFALYDKKDKKLYIARDRIGEKPLYYGWENKKFFFASELKGLKAHPEFIGNIDPNSVSMFLSKNYIEAPFSIYKNIYKVMPGEYIEIPIRNFSNNRILKKEFFWRLENYVCQSKTNNFQNSLLKIESLLEDSVREKMISDVPVGAFLSGGIDSSLIVSMMSKYSSRPIKTFTIGFQERGFNEAVSAKKVAEYLGTDHTELYLNHAEILDLIPLMSSIYDEPFSDSSQLPTYVISKLASSKVKVALTGDGGDEIFGGYRRHVNIDKWWSIINKMPFKLRKSISKVFLSLSNSDLDLISNYTSKFLKNDFKYQNLSRNLSKISKAINSRNLLEQYRSLTTNSFDKDLVIGSFNYESSFKMINHECLHPSELIMFMDSIDFLANDILTKVDRASMSVSLETRAPFLDHRLIEYSWSLHKSLKINKSQGKVMLRKLLNKHLPKDLYERPKMGFGIPLNEWIKGPLRDWVFDMLSRENIEKNGFLSFDHVSKILKEHYSGKIDNQNLIWSLVMFQSWIEKNK